MDNDFLKEYLDMIMVEMKEVKDRLESVEKQLSLYKFVINAIKVIGYTLVFVLAFKFGDVKSLWQNFGGK